MMRYIFTRSPTAEWNRVNPVLHKDQIGRDSDTGQFKVGDGVSCWRDLPWSRTLPEQIPMVGIRRRS